MPPRGSLFTSAPDGRYSRVTTRLTREEMEMIEQVRQEANATLAETIRKAIHEAFAAFQKQQHHNPNVPTLGQQVLTIVRAFPDTTATDYTDDPDALAFVAQELAKTPLDLNLDEKILREGKQRPETHEGRTE